MSLGIWRESDVERLLELGIHSHLSSQGHRAAVGRAGSVQAEDGEGSGRGWTCRLP